MTRHWFISTKYRSSSKLALTALGLAFFVILLGAYTRLTDAGLSCPDWPNCFGYLTAPYTIEQLRHAAQNFPAISINVTKAWTEMAHRYFAGIEGLLILALSLSILFTRKSKDLKARAMALILLTLLATQVTLGMLTVTQNLKPIIVSSHLVTGLSILGMLWWLYLDLQVKDDFFIKKSDINVRPWLAIGFSLLAAQICLGGWTSTHYAGLACIDFPFCNGQLLPNMQWQHLNTSLITIHMLHRFGALVTATYLSIMSICLLRNASFRPIACLLLALTGLQLTLGVLNVIWLRPVWLALLHHIVAIFLLLTMITALVKASLETRDHRHDAWIA